MILTVRTDKPEAEVGLYSDDGEQQAYETWLGHRDLSTTILRVVTDMLANNGITLDDIDTAIFYEGPGSFTGLRIGASFVNALQIPVVNASGDDWIKIGLSNIGKDLEQRAIPLYGSGAHITKPKK